MAAAMGSQYTPDILFRHAPFGKTAGTADISPQCEISGFFQLSWNEGSPGAKAAGSGIVEKLVASSLAGFSSSK